MPRKKSIPSFKWNPYFLWRILRTVPEYQAAVNEFISRARVANDAGSIELYEHLQSEDNVLESNEEGTVFEKRGSSPAEYLDTIEISKYLLLD